jgi:hypothetical protein
MSGQRDPDERHPDAAALAEYQAGLTGGLRGKRLGAHIASCARCAAVSDQLTGVSSALASAPAPPLPDEVERRIAAALATEAAPLAEAAPTAEPAAGPRPSRGNGSGPSRGDASGPSRGDSSGPSRGDASGPPRRARGVRGSRRLRPAVLVSSAAAAACLVVVGAVFLFGLVHFSSGSSSSSAASSAEAPLSAQAASPAGSPFGRAAAGGRAAGSAEKAAFTVTASGIRYEPATLATQVRAELAAEEVGRTPPPASAHLNTPGTPSYATLAACVLHLTDQDRPSLVDSATYQGKPVYVIAVPDHVWVVAPDCTASDPHLIRSIGL